MPAVKKAYLKFVAVWNRAVIWGLLALIWIFVLTPTALFRRFVKKWDSKSKKKAESFLKRSASLDPDHFKRPF